MAIFGHSDLYQSFREKLLEKIWNGHSKFIPVFLGKIVGKKLEQPFLAIRNLYQSLGKIIRKNSEWPFQIYTSLFGENCQKKFRMAIFGHSKFIPVFLGKIVGKKSEWPFLAIPNLYQSFWERLSEKIWNGHFWPFQIYTSFLGKDCWKNLEWPFFAILNLCIFYRKIVRKYSEWLFLAIPNQYQSFWGKLLEKIWNSHFWPF